MSNSLHSFKSNESRKKSNNISLSLSREQDSERNDDDITYSIFLNDSDFEPKLRNTSLDNNIMNSSRSTSNILPNSHRLYKFVLSSDDIGSSHKSNINKDSKNHASLVTLSTGVLNSTYNSDSNVNLSTSNNQPENNVKNSSSNTGSGTCNNNFLINVQSSPLDDIINSSNEYFSVSSQMNLQSDNNSSSHNYQQQPLLPPVQGKFIKRNSIANTLSTDASSTYRYYYNNDRDNSHMVPTIEEAVQLLRKDYITVPKPVKIRSEQSLSSIEFEPHEFQIIKKSHNNNINNNNNNNNHTSTITDESGKINRINQPIRNSIIDHLIIPSSDHNSPISTPLKPNSNIQVLKSIGFPNNVIVSSSKDANQINSTVQTPNYRTMRMTNSQMDLALEIPSIDNSNFKPQLTQSSSIVTSPTPTPTQIASTSELPPSPTYDSETDTSNDGDDDAMWHSSQAYPIQHIDSSSMQSYDSYGKEEYDTEDDGVINDMFSTSKIMMLILMGIVIPPLFFLVALGGNNGVLSDYYLLKLMMKHPQKLGLLQGFIWDIDLRWFRHLCFWIGCIETSLILACVAIGFGVGLTR